MNKGVFFAAGAYLLWGVFPVYWKAIQHIPAYQTVFHRMFWTLLFTVIILSLTKHWNWLHKLNKPVTIITFIATSVLICFNWLIFIWAVNNGFVVEASLGYFINPLINVILGVVFLKERLRGGQIFALAVATIGVLHLTFNYGSFPWIAIVLAITFGLYGLLRKTAALNSLEGLFLETGFMFIPALVFLILAEYHGTGAFGHGNIFNNLMLVMSGVITAIPLLMFASGARRITLTSLGVLQYIAPTLQFLIGVFIFKEAFPQTRFTGFIIVWAALIVYTSEALLFRRKRLRIIAEQVGTINHELSK